MVIDHIDGDRSNNEPSNLRVLCPPCNAIRHCGLGDSRGWITLGDSTMEQVEIVRKTRKIFEETGVIPDLSRMDPLVKPVEITATELVKMLWKTSWKDLPEEFQSLRGFFTDEGACLFQYTKLIEDTKVPNDHSTEAPCNNSD